MNGDVMKSYIIPDAGVDWVVVSAKLTLAVNMIATRTDIITFHCYLFFFSITTLLY